MEVNVAVVGATGLVGSKILEILEERDFPVKNLIPLASSKSAGKKIKFKAREYVVQELSENSFGEGEGTIAFFAAGGSISEKYVPIANERKVKVVDNSSHFRMVEGVPLIVPEVNGDTLDKNSILVANPNCSTIQSVIPLKALLDAYGIKRIVYTTYQAVSGAGISGIKDLENKTSNKFKYNIYDNVLPHIDVFLENGYTKEEMKMIDETHKIFADDSIAITATAARVPVTNSHSISINVELEREFEIKDVINTLKNQKGLKIADDTQKQIYPIPEMTTGKDDVYVGRIRRDYSVENGINMWVVADNIRKGAATNAVQIAELLI